jgi:hypothetical protein
MCCVIIPARRNIRVSSITNIKTPAAAAEVVKEGNAFAVPLKVKLTGNYYKIVDFLQQVEVGRPLCQAAAGGH